MRLPVWQAEAIEREVVEMLYDYGITSFPIDVLDVCTRLGISVIPYSELPEDLRALALLESDEGFSMCRQNFYDSRIVYNDDRNPSRIRFTIAHEMGHLWLEHDVESTEHEYQADYFAGYLLAPHPLLAQFSKGRSSTEVAHAFGMSAACLAVSFDQLNQRYARNKPTQPHERWVLEFCGVRT